MSVTIYPRDNKNICAEISDGTRLASATIDLMDFVLRKYGVGMGVYEGYIVFTPGRLKGLEVAMELIEYEVFKIERVSGDKSLVSELRKLRDDIGRIVSHCVSNGVEVIHFAD